LPATAQGQQRSPMALSAFSMQNLTENLPHLGKTRIQEVWAWNFREEAEACFEAVRSCSSGVFIAFDVEFPGFMQQPPLSATRNEQYAALRRNVDMLHPIQLGIVIADVNGAVRGAWSFNLYFSIWQDLHTVASLALLSGAGLNFLRHEAEGIDARDFGRWLATSPLIGQGNTAHRWLTFSGLYDLGYLLKLITAGRQLPSDLSGFEAALAIHCPHRLELRNWLPHGSLERHLQERGIDRQGAAHTAASDALATLQLFFMVVPSAQWAQRDAVLQHEPDAEPLAASDLGWPALEAPSSSTPKVLHRPANRGHRAAATSSWASAARQAAAVVVMVDAVR